MTWPLWLVIGLVIIAALITIVYEQWITRFGGYTLIDLPFDEVTLLARVYASYQTDEGTDERLLGWVVAYRDSDYLPPWQLHDRFEEKLSHMASRPTADLDSVADSDTDSVADSDTDSAAASGELSVASGGLAVMSRRWGQVCVTKEPGFNSYLIYHRNRRLLAHAANAWSHSAFHAALMPIEVILRVSLLPLQTMFDFVSHERRVVAGFIPSLPSLSLVEMAKRVCSMLTIVEGYDCVFYRVNKSAASRLKSSTPAVYFEWCQQPL